MMGSGIPFVFVLVLKHTLHQAAGYLLLQFGEQMTQRSHPETGHVSPENRKLVLKPVSDFSAR